MTTIKTWKSRLEEAAHFSQEDYENDKYHFMQAEIDELRAENAKLRVALGRAADDIESWGAYASEYFQKRWNLQRDIEAARAALGES